ncbi:MAG: hypothetical protein J07HQW2_03285 [Haloquadratum walsbyi J07HQW2]|uniref:Uncharacterized protein n=1 Tax=Haloquadratum walsbyi J07HQW2 TaxID=1238425 RepID=U1PWI9_9EURY|nr:MAG: hypothetical protein J07HQW2_03285 [Haloquadratum walsbyi J07HQW2]
MLFSVDTIILVILTPFTQKGNDHYLSSQRLSGVIQQCNCLRASAFTTVRWQGTSDASQTMADNTHKSGTFRGEDI